MNTTEIIDAMQEAIVARDCFIVEINISKDNDVEIVIEAESGIVTLDDCVELSRIFEGKFDREKEDYSLTVASAGLDRPFKVMKQFLKAAGTKVEVSFVGGRKTVGELESADEEGIVLKYTAREAVEGKKRKETVEHRDRFPMSEINAVVPFIEFE